MSKQKNYPALHTKITVVVDPGQPSELKFFSVVDEIKHDGRLMVPLPLNIIPGYIRPGLPVVIEYAARDAFFKYESQIDFVFAEKAGEDKDLFVMLIGQDNEPKKLQRRNHYRLFVSVPFRLKMVELPQGYGSDPEIKKQSFQQWDKEPDFYDADMYTTDLSGGGLGFTCDHDLEAGKVFYFILQLDRGTFQAAGEIVHCRELEGETDQKYWIGAKFVGLTEIEREAIIAYIFRVQNEQLHKEKRSR